MRIYILGIAGTLMASIASLACALGHEVKGCDQAIYPPMSDQLKALGVTVDLGYLPEHLDWGPDLVIIGNTLSRNDEMVQAVQARALTYTSGAAWLSTAVLKNRWVISVAGTHGKTTTTTLLTSVLKALGHDVGYLIAGQPADGSPSAVLGTSPYFVIESDEYDTAFFDKQAKFMHYHPTTLLINNLEFDHGDIYANLAAMEQQFSALIQALPENATVIASLNEASIKRVLSIGCQAKVCDLQAPDADFSVTATAPYALTLTRRGADTQTIDWRLSGAHNADNCRAVLSVLSTLPDAWQLVQWPEIIQALQDFLPPKRRLEYWGERDGVVLIDDFAHHPTAILKTVATVREQYADRRLVVLLGFYNYSMRFGLHESALPAALQQANFVYLVSNPNIKWDLQVLKNQLPMPSAVVADDRLIAEYQQAARHGDVWLMLGNRGLVLFDSAQ